MRLTLTVGKESGKIITPLVAQSLHMVIREIAAVVLLIGLKAHQRPAQIQSMNLSRIVSAAQVSGLETHQLQEAAFA
jgi:hypothetical protein